MTEPIIEYPRPWSYRLIGKDEALMRAAVEATCAERFADYAYSLTAGNVSRAGKYVSLNFEIIAISEEFRNEVFAALRGLPPVVYVL